MSPDSTPCVYQFSWSLGTSYLAQGLTSAGSEDCSSWAETCPARQIRQARESLLSGEDIGQGVLHWAMARSAGPGIQVPAATALLLLNAALFVSMFIVLWVHMEPEDNLHKLVLSFYQGVLEIELSQF